MQIIMNFLPRFYKNPFRLTAEVNLALFFKGIHVQYGIFKKNVYPHGHIHKEKHQKEHAPMLLSPQ